MMYPFVKKLSTGACPLLKLEYFSSYHIFLVGFICIAPPKILPNGSQTFDEYWQEEVIQGPSPHQVRQKRGTPGVPERQLNEPSGKIFGGAMQHSILAW